MSYFDSGTHRPPRRLFAWEHAFGAGMATAIVVLIAFFLAPAIEPNLRDFSKKQPLPAYTEMVFGFCSFLRGAGLLLSWAPAVTMGFLFGMLGTRGRRPLRVVSFWAGLGVVAAVGVAVSLYAPLLGAAMDFAGG